MSLDGVPVVDVTYYLRGGPFDRETAFSARSPKYGTGTTPDTPIAVPKGTGIYGLNVKIGNIRDIFYDFHTGECHYYVDGWDIEVTSDYIYRTYGEGAAWILHRYEGTSPADYLELDIPSVWEQQGYADGPFEPNVNGNALYVNVWRRRWQVFNFGEWSWDWEKVYTVTHYLKHTPWIKVTSEPSFANVKINPQRAGHPIYNGVTPCIYMPSMEFSGRTPFVIDISKDKYAPVTEGVELQWDGTSEFDHGYAVKHFVLNYQSCTNPDKPHGGTACSGYDKIQCNAGTWETLETDSPTCGYPKPRAKFSAAWTEGSPPLVVTFTDLSSDNPKSWTWDFGDGTGSSEQNPTHTYTAPGGHLVYLEVANQSGTDSAQATITVKSPCAAPEGDHGDVGCVDYDRVRCNDGTWEVFEENSGTCGYPAPVADFSASTVAGYAPLTIQFEDMSTQFPATWAWDFGDGITSDEQHPEHTYETPGDYLVTLTTSNHIGSSHTELAISVQEPEPEPIPILTDQTAQIVGIATMAGVGLVATIIASRRDNKNV